MSDVTMLNCNELGSTEIDTDINNAGIINDDRPRKARGKVDIIVKEK